MSSRPSDPTARERPWPWVLLTMALLWIALVRIPIVINAPVHLDSDLAVDGLRVWELAQGHWHWHFPGTPPIGITSALCALPQMIVWGPTPAALASGGVVEYELLALAIFLLARAAYGTGVACWCLVPLAFSSNGMVWLAGRLNGGHLFVAFWHAASLGWLFLAMARGTVKRWGWLGLWCGLGLWHDSMFLVTVGVITLVAVAARLRGGAGAPRWVCLLAFLAGLAAGDVPRELGNRLEPYDAYGGHENKPIWQRSVLLGHGRILAEECLPRLLSGRLLPDFHSEPPPEAVSAPASRNDQAPEVGPLQWAAGLVPLPLAILAAGALFVRGWRIAPGPAGAAQAAVTWSILLSSAAIVAAFIIHHDIYNSDNYRYIIYLFVTWSIGLGLALFDLARRSSGGAAAAGCLAVLLAALMTADMAQWYRDFGWIDHRLRPARVPLQDALLDWLALHPEVGSVYGGYWDVYRVAFLTGGRVRGVPFAMYPDRYPEWSAAGRPEILIVRPDQVSKFILRGAHAEGARPLMVQPGLGIFRWPPQPRSQGVGGRPG